MRVCSITSCEGIKHDDFVTNYSFFVPPKSCLVVSFSSHSSHRLDVAGPSRAPPCRSDTLVARLTNAATDTPAVGLLSRNRRDRISVVV